MSASAFETIARLLPGDHLCSIYTTEQEQGDLLSAYFLEGLKTDQKLSYIADPDAAERIRRDLVELGVEVENHLSQGRMEFLTSREAYARGGVFDAESMLQLLSEQSLKAREAGYGGLRVAIDMMAVTAESADTTAPATNLRDFENGLNKLVAGSNFLVLGQYDRRVFDPGILLDVLRTHSPAIVGTEAFDNFYYVPPEELSGMEPTEAELENWIGNLRSRARAEADLRSEQRFAEAVLETSGAVVVVLDRHAGIVRTNEACKNITGYNEPELHGLAMDDLVPEVERDDVSRLIDDLFGGTYPRKYEHHLITKEGEWRFLAWTMTLTRGDHGDVEYVIATGIDITERKLEEENKVRRLEAEIARMEHYASPGTTRVTGQAFSQQSLSERNQVEVEQLRKSYEETLLAGLEDSMYKTNNRVAERLRALAHSLGRLDAGPKDVVELHVKALRNISVGASAKRARALNEEARLLALELMGYLVTVYRNQVAITSATHTSATDREVSDE